MKIYSILFVFIFTLSAYAESHDNVDLKNCLKKFIADKNTDGFIANNDSCKKALDMKVRKEQKLILDAAKRLGALKSDIEPKKSILRKPLYSSDKITDLVERYLTRKHKIKINRYTLEDVSFDKQSQLWHLFYLCKPAYTSVAIYGLGCHFSVVADNEKVPGLRLVPGR